MGERAEPFFGVMFRKFGCPQEFLEGNWVERSEKQIFEKRRGDGCPRRRGRLGDNVIGDGVEHLDCLVQQVKLEGWEKIWKKS